MVGNAGVDFTANEIWKRARSGLGISFVTATSLANARCNAHSSSARKETNIIDVCVCVCESVRCHGDNGCAGIHKKENVEIVDRFDNFMVVLMQR